MYRHKSARNVTFLSFPLFSLNWVLRVHASRNVSFKSYWCSSLPHLQQRDQAQVLGRPLSHQTFQSLSLSKPQNWESRRRLGTRRLTRAMQSGLPRSGWPHGTGKITSPQCPNQEGAFFKVKEHDSLKGPHFLPPQCTLSLWPFKKKRKKC